MKKLLIENMKRLIELLECEDKEIYPTHDAPGCRSEIKSKMLELRRDTIRYDKELYDFKKAREIRQQSK